MSAALGSARSVSAIMLRVVLALIPGIALYAWCFGVTIIVQLLWLSAVAVLIDACCARLRGVDVSDTITDGTALVIAMLYGLCLPPDMPWWTGLTGMVFAVAIAKHAFGGLGKNVFNPAMVGYLAILISFPSWTAQDIAPSQQALDTLEGWFGPSPDAISEATPLSMLKNKRALGRATTETPPWTPWLIVGAGYLLGGLLLRWWRVIDLSAPTGFLLGLGLTAGMLQWFAPEPGYEALRQLGYASSMLAAFFIVTEPVSGAASRTGRLLFGLFVGIWTILFRRYGGYPDGIAFAVILGNALVPLIDRVTRSRIFGR